jgi:transcription initiation factor TFIID TATA-box-binding protein
MRGIRIENVVASTSLGSELDLPLIAGVLDGAEYEPDRFPGLIYRMKEPKTAILLFHSGKVVCTGGKSMTQVEDSIRTVSQRIQKGHPKILAHPKIEVQNIVATSNLGSEINLNSIAIGLGLDRVEYEPEQFPGLVYRLDKPRVVVLLFGSGKLVCTGARRPSDIQLSVELIRKELENAGLLGRDQTAEGSTPERTTRRTPRTQQARDKPPASEVSDQSSTAAS